MKKSTKYIGLAFALFALVGCTQSFCTNSDRANMLANYETSTVKYNDQEMMLWEKTVKEIEAKDIIVPTNEYFAYIEENVYYYAITDSSVNFETFGEKKLSSYTVDELKTAVGKDASGKEIVFAKSTYYANIKYAGHDETSENVSQILWHNFDSWTKTLIEDVYAGNEIKVGSTTFTNIDLDDLPSSAFLTEYKNALNRSVQLTTACITPVENVYGGIHLEAKSWGDAFNLGLIEGLIEYPIAWALHSFYGLFNSGALGAILSILIVTIIVRLFLVLVSFKSTMSQQKMQELQPKLNALQAKYPNSNTNEYEKRMLAQAQADLYKENGINPLSSLLVMFLQFPIFIAVWGAMSGSAILRVDTLFNGAGSLWELQLSANMNDVILKGNISAIILFVVMSAVQILSAKLPMWLQKKEQNKGPKMGKNPAMEQSQKQMNTMSNVMMIMIIFMGFTLPVGMAFYWVISAVISLAQSFIVRAITKSKKEKAGYAKYKTKK